MPISEFLRDLSNDDRVTAKLKITPLHLEPFSSLGQNFRLTFQRRGKTVWVSSKQRSPSSEPFDDGFAWKDPPFVVTAHLRWNSVSKSFKKPKVLDVKLIDANQSVRARGQINITKFASCLEKRRELVTLASDDNHCLFELQVSIETISQAAGGRKTKQQRVESRGIAGSPYDSPIDAAELQETLHCSSGSSSSSSTNEESVQSIESEDGSRYRQAGDKTPVDSDSISEAAADDQDEDDPHEDAVPPAPVALDGAPVDPLLVQANSEYERLQAKLGSAQKAAKLAHKEIRELLRRLACCDEEAVRRLTLELDQVRQQRDKFKCILKKVQENNNVSRQMQLLLEEADLIESTIYGSGIELEFEANSAFPKNVLVLADALDDWQAFNPPNPELLTSIVNALKNCFAHSVNNPRMLSHWLSFTCHLFLRLKRELPANLLLSGGMHAMDFKTVPKDALGRMEPVKQFFFRLAYLAHDIFHVLLILVFGELEPLLTGIMTYEPSSSERKPLELPVSILDLFNDLRRNRVDCTIIRRLLEEVLSFLEVQLFNAILHRDLFTCGFGCELRLALFEFEEAVTRLDPALREPCRSRFERLSQAANLMLLNSKNLVTNAHLIQQIFSKLNLAQITRIVENLQPDEFAPTFSNRELLQAVSKLRFAARGTLNKVSLEPYRYEKINIFSLL